MGKRFQLAKLTAAVVAAAAFQGGSAATLNPHGTGEYLIYPYYTTNGGFTSQIRIVNSTDDFKIVKLRFRESSHSEDVFDILIYLTPRDQFHGIVERVGDTVRFRSNDTTCTYPLNPTWYNGLNLKPAAAPWDFRPRSKNISVDDLSEGYAEVIEVATIPVGTPIFVDTDGDGSGETSLLALLSHAASSVDIDDDGVPENTGEPNGGALISGNRGPCAALLDAWDHGVAPAFLGAVDLKNWSSAAYSRSWPQIPYNEPPQPLQPPPQNQPRALLSAPEGGLWGYMAYINARDAVALASDAVPIENYSNLVQHYKTNDQKHFHLPNLASGGIDTALFIDPDNDFGAKVTWRSIADDDAVNPLENPNASFEMDRDNLYELSSDPNAQTPDNSLEAMASQMLAAGIMNDYFLDPDQGMAGATNWVVTFPAAIFGGWDVDRSVIQNQQTKKNSDPLTRIKDGVKPNLSPRRIDLKREIDNRLGPKTIGNRKICIPYTLSTWDREEQADILFQPSPVGPVRLCREVNVLEFQQLGGVHADLFASPNAIPVVVNPTGSFSMDHGWGMLLFRNPTKWTDTTRKYAEWGYPVVGFSAMTAAVGDTRLGETVPHKRVRLYCYPNPNNQTPNPNNQKQCGPNEIVYVDPQGTVVVNDPSVKQGIIGNQNP